MKAQGVRTVKDLLLSPTFLQSLTPSERSELLKPGNTAPSSPDSRSHPLSRAAPDVSSPQHSAGRYPQADAGYSQDSQWTLSCCVAATPQQHVSPAAAALPDRQQLVDDSMLLLQHRAQLQTQVEDLQRQLAHMQKEQQQQQQHARQQQQLRKASADPPNHAVIAGLRTSMAQVSSMASTVSQENKLLVAENKRLVELRDQQAGVVAQLQGRIHQLEGTLLQQLEHSSRNTLKTADEASVGAKLDALLSPELLAAVAAVQPPAGSSGGGSSSSSVLLEELVGNNNQLRPLLRELAALRRSEQGLQKQVDQLQLQLATADRDLQAAAAAAASDKALARRTITQAHSRLSAALQRLKALAERQQRQSLLLQEREAYIARLERLLVQQNNDMMCLASINSSSSSANNAASKSNVKGLRSRPNLSARHSAGGSNSSGGGGGGARAVNSPCKAQQLQLQQAGVDHSLEHPQAQSLSPAAAAGVSSHHRHNQHGQQQQQQQNQSPGSPVARHRSPSPQCQWPQQQQQQQQQQLPQRPRSSPGRRTWHQHAQELLQQQERQQQQDVQRGAVHSREGHRSSSPPVRVSSPERQPSPLALAASRTVVAMQCREIMTHTAGGDSGLDQDNAAAVAAAAHNPGGSVSPRKSRGPGMSDVRPAAAVAAAVDALPQFTAAAAAGRHRTAGPRAQTLRHASSRSSATAGAAAKRIAAAAAAVAALDAGTRGLWGSTTPPPCSGLRGGTSPGQGMGRLTPQQLQQQRQLRLRELLQQKQRRPAQPSQQQGGSRVYSSSGRRSSAESEAETDRRHRLAIRRSAAAAAAAHSQQQQQQWRDGDEEDGSDSEGVDNQQQQQGCMHDLRGKMQLAVASPEQQWQHQQQQQHQPFGFRSASAPPAAAAAPSDELSFSPPAAQYAGHARGTSATPAAAAASTTGKGSRCQREEQEEGLEASLAYQARVHEGGDYIARTQPSAHGDGDGEGGVEGDSGLMGEVLAMQQNLQELEQDLLQLGCGL